MESGNGRDPMLDALLAAEITGGFVLVVAGVV